MISAKPAVVVAMLALAGVPGAQEKVDAQRIANSKLDEEVRKLVQDLVSEDYGIKVRLAKPKFESLQVRAIPELIKLLDRDELVKLTNTADLIYPGAKMFYGHGGILPYDIDWLSVRAGWVLEELTFRRFGFQEEGLNEESIRRLVPWVPRDVPLEDIFELEWDPEVRRTMREEAVSRAKEWWSKAQSGWKRLDDLEEALMSDSFNRQSFAIEWMRYGKTACEGLDLETYRERLLPLIQRLGDSSDKGVRVQAMYLLEDTSFSWLDLKRE